MLGAYNDVILQPMFPNRPTCCARIGSPFTRADLLHDFSGPTNRHDKSQRVNRPLSLQAIATGKIRATTRKKVFCILPLNFAFILNCSIHQAV